MTSHGIRHTFATAGVPLAFVAEALGHADTRMVSKHYARLAPNVVHDTICANLLSFGVQTEEKVHKLRSTIRMMAIINRRFSRQAPGLIAGQKTGPFFSKLLSLKSI
jgi:hypothetical protein